MALTAPAHTISGVPKRAAMVAAVICPTSPHSEKKIAANDTIAGLRDQLTRDQAALDRERGEQHRLAGLLHDILTSRPAPASTDQQHPRADGGSSSTGHQPADTAGNGTSRRQPPR